MVDEMDERTLDEDADAVAWGGRIPETLRKALVTGVSAVLMTEEGIRNALGDLRLPKEAVGYVIQQTERSRKELFNTVSSEVKGFLKNADLTGELRKALTGLKVEVKAEFRFVETGEGRASVKTAVKDVDEDDEENGTPRRRRKKRRS